MPYEVIAEAPPTQVILALAMLSIDVEDINAIRRPGGRAPAPPRWQRIHAAVDRAAAFIAKRG